LASKQASVDQAVSKDSLLLQTSTSQIKTLDEADLRNLYFGDFLRSKEEARTYEEMTNLTKLKEVIENYLLDFNLTSKVPMDLVVFGFMIEHVSRISRILKQSNGHGLLIGIGGSGRSSATKLAAYIADFEVFQIEVSKKYTLSEWKSDLKTLMKKTGELGTNVVFLFCDHQIKDETFLEDINTLLNSSDIPSLFESEERLEIIEKVAEIASD
jgi:dynein heavy chain